MTDYLAKAREKAEREIKEAEKKMHIANVIPDTGMRPLIVIQKGLPWLSYKPESFSDILRAMDAFQIIPALDYKGRYRGVKCADEFNPERDGELLGTYSGWMELNSRCSAYLDGDQRATFAFFARLSDGSAVEVHFDISAAYYCKCPMPMELRATYSNSSRSGMAQGEWYVRRPAVAGIANAYCNYSTGAPYPGMAHHGRAMFSDLRAYVAGLVEKQK